MSRNHSPSVYAGRTGGPHYCLFCNADWPCAGYQMEQSDEAQRRTQQLIDENRRLIQERDLLRAEIARLAAIEKAMFDASNYPSAPWYAIENARLKDELRREREARADFVARAIVRCRAQMVGPGDHPTTERLAHDQAIELCIAAIKEAAR